MLTPRTHRDRTGRTPVPAHTCPCTSGACMHACIHITPPHGTLEAPPVSTLSSGLPWVEGGRSIRGSHTYTGLVGPAPQTPASRCAHTRGAHSGGRLARAGAPRGAPRGWLSAWPSTRRSAVANDAFDGGRICCERSERAPIIWKAEIRNAIYSAALWKQFPALYNPILGQPPGAGQITIGYSLSSPGTKISRPR